MNKLNTTSVSLAVTPTVISTLFSHYLNRKPLKQRPTAHLSYDEGLQLIRSFLDFASHHTVEELQAFTRQWVPHPQWVKVDTIKIDVEHLNKAAELLQDNLGEDGIRQVGGREWWQWRQAKSPLQAEWIEMRSDAKERKKTKQKAERIMLYIHGGAYYFGSVDEHRYQMQRHARKLKARVLAPRYRLSPQFPFPCGLQDCIAAYLYLLTVQDPSTIVLAGDSAGGGMALAMLCLLRDQGIPLPAGGVLLSPWVDLTHSFPSVAGDSPMDYIPKSGFHHKPSRAWPPPNEDDMAMLVEKARMEKAGTMSKPSTSKTLEAEQQAPVAPENEAGARPSAPSGGVEINPSKFLSVVIDGEKVTIKDQIQMYTTNLLLAHPLVSPVMQPTLGGLPPLLVMVGGGEILRDEQVYIAHKCANPAKYAPPTDILTQRGQELLAKYKPTDVQLQIWDDLCHVAPTLSFTRPAKHMYRSVAQFGAWALARAQHKSIDILDDDNISIISTSGSDTEVDGDEVTETSPKQQTDAPGQVGKAGDPLPRFHQHMIRQRVTRHGVTLPLGPESDLPGCCMDHNDIGLIKEGPVKKWLATKSQWDRRYSSAKAKVHQKIIKDMNIGFHEFGPHEEPPPSALAGRRRVDLEMKAEKRSKSVGLAIWSLWGSKHDEDAVEREKKADQTPETKEATPAEGQGARPFQQIEEQQPPATAESDTRSRSRRRTVVDENQTGSVVIDEDTPVAQLLSMRKEKEEASRGQQLLSPNFVPETGVAGKRPFLGGIAVPFSLGKEADTASMVTLNSGTSPPPGTQPITPMEPTDDPLSAAQMKRPQFESFVTAEEGIPQTGKSKAA